MHGAAACDGAVLLGGPAAEAVSPSAEPLIRAIILFAATMIAASIGANAEMATVIDSGPRA
jgi:hypothetical protein